MWIRSQNKEAINLMNKIRYEDIIKSVDKQSCPGVFICRVATTCYEENRRRAICLDCWMKTMEERKVEVIYEGEYATRNVSSETV